MNKAKIPQLGFGNDSFEEDHYKEPCFASLLRCFGNCMGYTLGIGSCGCCCYPYKTVEKGSKAVVKEFGRLKREVSDGMHPVNPLTEKLVSVDMRLKVIDLGKQDVITADNLSATIHSIVYYQVTNVQTVLFKVDNVEKAIVELAHSILRNVIGKSTLQTCLEEREKIAKHIGEIIEEQVASFGAHITNIQIKDIVVPKQTMELLSSAATARKEAEAKIITAQADVKAAELMRAASDILDSPAAMQIRQLEVLERLSASPNAKIVFMNPNSDMANSIKNTTVSTQLIDH